MLQISSEGTQGHIVRWRGVGQRHICFFLGELKRRLTPHPPPRGWTCYFSSFINWESSTDSDTSNVATPPRTDTPLQTQILLPQPPAAVATTLQTPPLLVEAATPLEAQPPGQL